MADPYGDYQQAAGLLSGLSLNPYGMDPEKLRQLTGLLAPQMQAPGLGIPTGLLGGRMAQNAATSAADAAMLPGDVYQGKVDLNSPEGFARVQNMAGSLAGGGVPNAESGAVGIFGGKLAKTADLDALKRAEGMAGSGADRDAIWNQTGWFQGPDQQWRFEIPDQMSYLKGSGSSGERSASQGGTVGGVLDHLGLLAAYPELADVAFAGANGKTALKGQYVGRDILDPDVVATLRLNNQLNPVQQRSTMLHELQHAVQEQEGFAPGANAMDATVSAVKPGTPAWEFYQQQKASMTLTPEVFGAVAPGKDYQSYLKQVDKDAKLKAAQLAYTRTAGEVEARNIQTRADLSPEELIARPPWQTQDVPFGQQIVKKR